MNSRACRLLRFEFFPGSADAGLLALRVWIGLTMLLLHGVGKITGFSAMAAQFPAYFGLSPAANLVLVIFAEVVCSALLVLGLLTRFAALVSAITMAVAFFIAHHATLTGEHNGEMAFLYLAVYVALFVTGGGRYALDACRCKSST